MLVWLAAPGVVMLSILKGGRRSDGVLSWVAGGEEGDLELAIVLISFPLPLLLARLSSSPVPFFSLIFPVGERGGGLVVLTLF